MIKAVVFDFGGVIRLNDNENILERISQALGVPVVDLKKAYWERNHLSNVQNMKWEDMIIEVARVFDKSARTENRIRKLVQEHEAANRINTDLLALFSMLRRAGLKVAILSNATSELRKHLEEDGIAPLVDEIVVSGEIGYQKPHKEAFDACFKKLGVLPEETIFVDDSPKSLEKANEIGYVPILFKNNDQLRVDLKKLRVLTAETA
jgi:HAD superfamily hydrolase (TIGR01509 family)